MTVSGRRDEKVRSPFGKRPGAARSSLHPEADEFAPSGAIEFLSRSGDACLRPHGALDEPMARRLEREAVALIDDGVEQLVIDLRAVESLTPSTSGLLWAVHRYGRAKGSRLTVVVGDTPAVRAMDRAGLLSGLTRPPAREQPFFDWTR
jgi:anti-anti-sigma regulatory factor